MAGLVDMVCAALRDKGLETPRWTCAVLAEEIGQAGIATMSARTAWRCLRVASGKPRSRSGVPSAGRGSEKGADPESFRREAQEIRGACGSEVGLAVAGAHVAGMIGMTHASEVL